VSENLDFFPLNSLLTGRQPFDENYSVIEETDDFVVIFKKSGIAVQVTDKQTDDLERILEEKYKGRVYVLNRIDQPVAGLVIFGKNKAFTQEFSEMIQKREVKKTYLALVAGEPNPQPTILKHYIKKLHNRAMTADEKIDDSYKECELKYTLIKSFDNYHLLKVDLITGRFHQIRAQLATVGLPIKGDLKYGSKRPNLDRSIGLLSYQLEFVHPVTRKVYKFTSALPQNDVLWGLVDVETDLGSGVNQ